jgi:excisionase family DNA binding protein
MDSIEKWYSVKEVAGLCGVSSDTVRHWIQRKLPRAFKFPGRSNRRRRAYDCFRISEGALDRFTRVNMTSPRESGAFL